MAAPGKHPKRGRKPTAKATAHKPGIGRKPNRGAKAKTKRSTSATAAPATA